MHAFVEDSLIVYDAFGLTRVTLSTGKVKHNKKVVGHFMIQNGPLLVGHSEVANSRFAMTVPDLKVVPVGDAWNYNLTYGYSLGITADGLPFEINEGQLVIYDTKGKQRGTLSIKPKTKLKRIDLGPVLPVETMHWSPRVAAGPDGTFVVFADGELIGGKLSAGKKPAIGDTWSVPVARTQGRLHLRAGTFGAFVSAFHCAQNKAYCALVAGGKVKTEVIDCLGPVDFDGTRIVYQSSPTEVHRKPFGGDAIERIGLPTAGIGEVMADGDHLLFVTPDRERIRDLVNDEVYDRGLPADEQPNRKKLLAFVEKFREPARAANLTLYLEALRPPAYGEGPRPDWGWDEGDQSLLRTCLIGNLLAQSYEDRELSSGGYSHPQYCARGTEAAVDQMLAAIDDYDLDLVAGMAMLETPLDNNWEARSDEPKQPFFDKPAARKLLWAILERVAGKKLRAPEKLTPEWIVEKFDPATDRWEAGRFGNAQKATALLVVDYFEAKATPILIDWLIERASGMVDANMHIVGDCAKALVTAYPKTRAALEAHLAKAIAGKDAEKARRAESLQGSLPIADE